jgi:hypothetical protein
VHDGRAHALERFEGLLQLALDGPLVGDLLLELAGGDARLVQQTLSFATMIVWPPSVSVYGTLCALSSLTIAEASLDARFENSGACAGVVIQL